MNTWQLDIIDELAGIQSEQDLFRELVARANELEFEYVAYGLRPPLPITKSNTVLLTNYPSAWQQKYAQSNYIQVDPTVKHAMKSQMPMVWSDEVFESTPDFWEEAQSHQIRVGWAQATLDGQGFRGMLVVSRGRDALSAPELDAKTPHLAWLTQVAHQLMATLLKPRFVQGVNENLSSREIEILRWTADGKTSSEIADIIHISERTVNFHVNNAIVKLNVANKTAATVKAAILGLLY